MLQRDISIDPQNCTVAQLKTSTILIIHCYENLKTDMKLLLQKVTLMCIKLDITYIVEAVSSKRALQLPVITNCLILAIMC